MSTGLRVLETGRLVLRRFVLEDAAFVVDLVNDPAWIANIGDRGVRTLDDARAYMKRAMLAQYDEHGFGMWLVELKEKGKPIGTCGLVKRKGLDDVDIGFAFLPHFRNQGYAREAAAAVLDHARKDLALHRIVAIVTPSNERSIKLLEALGLSFDRTVRLPNDDEELSLYAVS